MDKRFSFGKLSLAIGFGLFGLVFWLGITESASAFFDVRVKVKSTGYYINVSSMPKLDINAGAGGGMSVIKDVINVKTNLNSGYKLYLSTNTEGVHGNRIYHKTNSAYFLNPTTGTIANPATLSMNSWGFALKQNASAGISNGFDLDYNVDNPNSESKWARVPVKGDPVELQKVKRGDFDLATISTVGKDLEIFYGVKTDGSLIAGSYSTTLLYTAMGNTSVTNNSTPEQDFTGNLNISRTNKLNGGEKLKITTSLYTTRDPGQAQVTVGGEVCTNLIKKLNNGVLVLECDTPALEVGEKDVVVVVPRYNISFMLSKALEYYKDRGTFNEITEMQSMTPEICEAETTPYAFENNAVMGKVASVTTRVHSKDRNLVPETELIDVRDNKKYIVRKLADGKCWMVQNLDLDLSTGITLTSATSDVASSWTPNNTTQDSPGVAWDPYTSDNQARSYDPGEKYLTGTGTSDQAVSSSGPKTAHVGNIYNWYAATAGSGTYSISSTGRESPYSVCPKGWKLPYGNNSRSNTADSGDFRKLTNTYGITSGADTTINDVSSADKLISAPLNFVRSGSYNFSNGDYDYRKHVYFWSSSVFSDRSAHNFYFDTSKVFPQYDTYKGYGFSVRCIAR